MSSLVIENLTVGYAKKPVLENVSLTFMPSQITALIGKNGCGKSTLLKTILGFIKPRSGEINLDGKSIASFRPKALAQKLSYLPQIQRANLDLDVKTIVSLGQYPYQGFWLNTRPNEELIKKALAKFNLETLANKPYNELSGGEAQRVWLAMLYVQQPEYILLDEPTTFLDIGYQVELLDYLKELTNSTKIGVILVIHDINMASKYADYIYILDSQKVKYAGKPEEIITSKALKEVFGFEGELIKHNNKNYLLP